MEWAVVHKLEGKGKPQNAELMDRLKALALPMLDFLADGFVEKRLTGALCLHRHLKHVKSDVKNHLEMIPDILFCGDASSPSEKDDDCCGYSVHAQRSGFLFGDMKCKETQSKNVLKIGPGKC